MDGRRYSGDVADPDRCREGRRESLEMADITLIPGIVVMTGNDLQAVAKFTNLDKAEAHGEKDSGANEKNDEKGQL